VDESVPIVGAKFGGSTEATVVDVPLPEPESSATVALSKTRYSSNSADFVCFCRVRLLEWVEPSEMGQELSEQ